MAQEFLEIQFDEKDERINLVSEIIFASTLLGTTSFASYLHLIKHSTKQSSLTAQKLFTKLLELCEREVHSYTRDIRWNKYKELIQSMSSAFLLWIDLVEIRNRVERTALSLAL